MKQFKFNGEWEYELDLQEFLKSNSKWAENMGSVKLGYPIKLKILDVKNLEPDPLQEQIETINYILNNEVLVLESLCKALKTINKFYGDSCGDHEWYPKEMKSSELGAVFLINEIEIFTEHKHGKAYFQFSGGYKGDFEHGLIVVMHEDRLIDHNQVGEDGYDGVYDDLGELGTKFRDFNIKHQKFGEDRVHRPIPKYGKYKPWQLYATEVFLENLIRTNKNEAFIREFEKSNLAINFRFPFIDRNLMDIAVTSKNLPIISYLIKNGAEASKSLIKCTYRTSFNPETINCLLENGVSIDTITYEGMTPLGNEIKNFTWYIGSLVHYKAGDSRIESTLKKMELSKEKIEFYINASANPNHIDNQANGYKTILAKHHNQEQLKKHKAYEVLEKILFPNGRPSNKWKFWKN